MNTALLVIEQLYYLVHCSYPAYCAKILHYDLLPLIGSAHLLTCSKNAMGYVSERAKPKTERSTGDSSTAAAVQYCSDLDGFANLFSI